MRDFDETHLRNKNQDAEPFVNIEHINIQDEFDEEDAFTNESRMAGSNHGAQNHPPEFDQHSQKKTLALSLLSKRTLLVSGLIMVGFIGIFMWSWIFEVLGLFSGSGTANIDKPQAQVTEIINLPAQEPSSQLAMAPGQVQNNPRNPKGTEPSSLPAVSKAANAAQGVSIGGTQDVQRQNVKPVAASENRAPVTFEPRMEPRREPTPLHKTMPQPVGASQDRATSPATTSKVEVKNPETENQNIQPAQNSIPMQANTPDVSNEETIPKTGASMPEVVSEVIIENVNTSTNQQKLIEKQLREGGDMAHFEPKSATTEKPKLAVNQHDTLLLNRKPEHFTIQILGMQDEQKLKAFMNNCGLKTKMSSYKTLRDGKSWYVIVYGDFETKQQAEAALLNLPQEIQKNKPWIRTMREVQGAIRAKS